METRTLAKPAFVVLCSMLPASSSADLPPRSARKTSPDFTITDSTGASIKLSGYKGKVVLLDFWATWCHGCQEEIPWHVNFQHKYRDTGLSAVGVSLDEDGWKSVRPFATEKNEKKMNYPVVIGKWNDMARRFGFDQLPVTLLIDRDGKIADFHIGMVDRDAFEKEIQTLLQETASANSGI